MAHCTQCGAALEAGARYCARCGSAAVQPTLPVQAMPPAPPPGPAPPAARRDTSGAQLVILIGALLAFLGPAFIAFFILFFGALFSAFGPFGFIPGAFIGFFGVILLLGGVLFGVAGLWARNVVRDGDPEKGALIAGGVGLVACLVGNVLGGVVLLLGGIMAYTAK